MPRVFNSGYGGYICDGCSMLLYSGEKDQPYWWVAADSVVTIGDKMYCKDCGEKNEH